MKMTFRWYGSKADPIPLRYIKQIPGMTGLMGLLDKPAGAVWEEDEVRALVHEVHEAGLELEVIESVNVHEDIKLGLPSRDAYIENYRATIRRLARYGVKVIVYNFMPVFDWLRTDLARLIPEDGSNSLYFDEKTWERWGRWKSCAGLPMAPTASHCPAGSRNALVSWKKPCGATRA